jgi:hypothetical protein
MSAKVLLPSSFLHLYAHRGRLVVQALGVGIAAPAQVKEEQRLNEAQFGPLHVYLVRAIVVK